MMSLKHPLLESLNLSQRFSTHLMTHSPQLFQTEEREMSSNKELSLCWGSLREMAFAVLGRYSGSSIERNWGKPCLSTSWQSPWPSREAGGSGKGLIQCKPRKLSNLLLSVLCMNNHQLTSMWERSAAWMVSTRPCLLQPTSWTIISSTKRGQQGEGQTNISRIYSHPLKASGSAQASGTMNRLMRKMKTRRL